MPDVADDEGSEDEEQGHHREGRGRAHHLCGSQRSQCVKKKKPYWLWTTCPSMKPTTVVRATSPDSQVFTKSAHL